MADRDDELAESIDDLTETIGELREELEPRERRPRPRFRPPTPGELLRLTDEVAIPTLLAILEANVRALEAFQQGIRVVRGGQEVRERSEQATDSARTRADELRRTTLDQLDGALAELQRAAEDGGLPRNRQARELIEDARDLRDEVDRRLRDAAESEPETAGRTIEIDDGTEPDDGDDPADVDVDAELETLKDQFAADEESDENDDSDGSDGSAGNDSDQTGSNR
ncbi:DUF7547 family protein [Natrialbaceae archaeon A-gly3]